MKVGDIGEFGLIKIIREMTGCGGDDAFLWKGSYSLSFITVDALVEGVHFDRDFCSMEDVGWKAIVSGVSDIAGMGALPRYAVISLGIPSSMEVSEIEGLYRGILEASSEYGVSVAGGNITRSDVFFVSTSVIGEGEGYLSRNCAVPGELIGITGFTGLSSGGLRVLREGKDCEFLKMAYLRPRARAREGRLLLGEGVRCAIDVSDGVVMDLKRICEESGVGARIWVRSFPVHPKLKEEFGDEALVLALSGGEDYELLFTAEDRIMERLKKRMPNMAVIGEILKEPRKVIDEDGREIEGGWEHLKS